MPGVFNIAFEFSFYLPSILFAVTAQYRDFDRDAFGFNSDGSNGDSDNNGDRTQQYKYTRHSITVKQYRDRIRRGDTA